MPKQNKQIFEQNKTKIPIYNMDGNNNQNHADENQKIESSNNGNLREEIRGKKTAIDFEKKEYEEYDNFNDAIPGEAQSGYLMNESGGEYSQNVYVGEGQEYSNYYGNNPGEMPMYPNLNQNASYSSPNSVYMGSTQNYVNTNKYGYANYGKQNLEGNYNPNSASNINLNPNMVHNMSQQEYGNFYHPEDYKMYSNQRNYEYSNPYFKNNFNATDYEYISSIRMQREAKRKPKMRICTNCSTTNTPSWRRSKDGKKLLCNACGLYAKLHNRPRPFSKSVDGRTKATKTNGERYACVNCRLVGGQYFILSDKNYLACRQCGDMEYYTKLYSEEKYPSYNYYPNQTNGPFYDNNNPGYSPNSYEGSQQNSNNGYNEGNNGTERNNDEL